MYEINLYHSFPSVMFNFVSKCLFSISDDELPNITCPADVMNNTTLGLANGSAMWSNATVTDNSGETITPVVNETSGSSFDIGVHTVQFTATDSSGNSNNCTFTVTIEGKVIPVSLMF